jgi:tetratricopeptide (TPR) repeat protein
MVQTRGLSPKHDAESRVATRLLPAPLRQPRPLATDRVRTLKVRVWADPAYRRGPLWREHLARVFARVNDYLRESLAVELEAEIKAWDEEVDASDLDRFLAELERHDPGEGVDHVIGMTSALPVLSSSLEMLGRAWSPGKHIVLRAMTDALEHEALAEALPTLTKTELDELHRARAAHKEDVVLLHEWAHNYGLEHEEGREHIMSPGYSHEASRFSDANLQLLTLAIAARREGRVDLPRAERPAAPDAGFDEAVARAAGQGAAGELREALAGLDALRARASEPWQHGRLGEAYLGLGAYSRALEELEGAKGLAGEAEVRANLVVMRRQRGVYGVPAHEEPEATAAVEAAHAAFAGGDKAKARRQVAEGLRRWKDLSGLLALRCALELEAGKTRAAEATCRRAVEAGDESVMAHYFSGHAQARAGKPAAAARHFERAIELDPGTAPAYEALAPLYEGEPAKLDDLRRRYRERFRKSLGS